MSNEVVCVYQDCPMCGSKGNELKKVLISKGIQIRKVSFASPEGKELITEALSEHGIGTMPFYVKDGKFSTDVKKLLNDYVPEEKFGKYVKATIAIKKPVETVVEKPKKRVRKTKKVKEA